jgi:RNA 2',3'-cyclic 3'-phosphodiesterase
LLQRFAPVQRAVRVRLFLAVPAPPSPAYAEAVAEVRAAFAGARPVRDGSWHATLRFLGEVADLRGVVSAVGPVAARHAPIPVEVAGLGAFPRAERARVVWMGLQGHGLAPLAADLAAATPLPHDRDADRPFAGHITIARLDPPADARALVERWRGRHVASATVDRVVLFRSDPAPGGPLYTPVQDFPLARA